MSKIMKKDRAEIYRGKADEDLEWGGIRFRFPFSDFLPEPTKSEVDRLRKDIQKVGVREPISIMIPNVFHLNGTAPSSTTGREPPVMLEVEDERLVQVPRNSANAGKNTQVLSSPPVLLIDGEVRLRLAIEDGKSLDEIPFRIYPEPPMERDEQFKELLRNQGERDKYDALFEGATWRMRLIMDLWLTSTTRRGGLSDDGYARMIATIDHLFSGQFELLSNRRMAKLLGTNRNKVGILRTRLALGDDETDALDRLGSMKSDLYALRNADKTIERAFSELRQESPDEFQAEEMDGYRSALDACISFRKEKVKSFEVKIDEFTQSKYLEYLEGSVGAFDAFVQSRNSLSEQMDEFIFGEIDGTSNINYDDIMNLIP